MADDHPTGEAPAAGYVDDGFGSACLRCGPRCDLQVVRPGRFQCNVSDDEHCPDASWRTGLGAVDAKPCPDGEAHVAHERDDNLWCPGVREAPAADPEADAPPPAYLTECARHGLALTQMPAIPTCCERRRIVGQVLVGDTGQPATPPARVTTTEWQRQNVAELRAALAEAEQERDTEMAREDAAERAVARVRALATRWQEPGNDVFAPVIAAEVLAALDGTDGDQDRIGTQAEQDRDKLAGERSYIRDMCMEASGLDSALAQRILALLDGTDGGACWT